MEETKKKSTGFVQLTPSEKKAAVEKILSGEIGQRAMAEQLGVSRKTVWGWVSEAKSHQGISSRAMTSLADRQRYVREIASGILTVADVMKVAGVKLPTVEYWIKSHSNDVLISDLPAREYIKDSEEQLAKENQELKIKLIQMQRYVLALESVIEVAGEERGEDLRKKFGSKR